MLLMIVVSLQALSSERQGSRELPWNSMCVYHCRGRSRIASAIYLVVSQDCNAYLWLWEWVCS